MNDFLHYFMTQPSCGLLCVCVCFEINTPNRIKWLECQIVLMMINKHHLRRSYLFYFGLLELFTWLNLWDKTHTDTLCYFHSAHPLGSCCRSVRWAPWISAAVSAGLSLGCLCCGARSLGLSAPPCLSPSTSPAACLPISQNHYHQQPQTKLEDSWHICC